MRYFGFILLVSTLYFPIHSEAQTMARDTQPRNGAWATLEVVDGDSTFLMSLHPARIVAPRKFKDLEEQKQYDYFD